MYESQKEGYTADQYLNTAKAIMAERGKEYDQEDGERSIADTVRAFNAITGNHLTESDGWVFMCVLKLVRQCSKPGLHRDSAVDLIAYSALLAESLEEVYK